MIYTIDERVPTLEEYRHIWETVGWGELNDLKATVKSLARSVYAIIAICDGKTVGMGRIIGDGVAYFYIQDVAVLPEYQKMGIGKGILDKLMEYLKSNASGKFVGLFASKGSVSFYEKYGFKDHSPGMTGMCQVLPK